MDIMLMLLAVACGSIVQLEASRGARFVQEIDIGQEVMNLKIEVNGLKTKLNEKDAEIADLRNQIGSTYTRWGRTICPGNGTNLIYSGFMAGTYHNSSRGTATGANYLCLAGQPTWDHYSETANNLIRITGVEYQFYAHTVASHDIKDYFGADIYNNNAPCSVCRSKRSTNVMIPGRTDCYPGWTKEYSGYLVGGYQMYDDSTEYVCLDRRPESVVNSGTDYNDNKLYFVETFCGQSLECPPYIGNRELACVVCSL